MSDRRGGNKSPPPIQKSSSDTDLCMFRRHQLQEELFKKEKPTQSGETQKQKDKEKQEEEEEEEEEEEDGKDELSQAHNQDIKRLIATFTDIHQDINNSLKYIIGDQKKSRKAVLRMKKELNELKEEMKAIRFKIQPRECVRGETYSIVYDHGTKRTEYTENLKEAVAMYMEKVMGIPVKVEEALKVGHLGDPQNYIYAKVIETNKGGKLSVMCRARCDGEKKNIHQPTKRQTVQEDEQDVSEPPPKMPKKEEISGLQHDAAAKAIIDFLLLRMKGNTSAT